MKKTRTLGRLCLSLLLCFAMLGCTAFAAEIEPRARYSKESTHKAISADGYNFHAWTTAYYGDDYCTSVWIENDSGEKFPTDMIELTAFVADQNKKVVRTRGPIHGGVGSSFLTVQCDPIDSYFTPAYFSGKIKINYRGGGAYTGESPTLRYENGKFQEYSSFSSARSVPDFPLNSQGLTYGSILDGEPDLVAAVGVDGVEGYVLYTDLCPEFFTTRALDAYNQRLEENNLIPLFDLELNRIGWFAIDIPSEMEYNPLLEEEIQNRLVQSASVLQAEDPEPLNTSWDDCPWLEELSEGLVNGDYPRNAKGQTFGSILQVNIVGYKPDWISCVGDNGVSGYFSAIAEKHHCQGIGGDVVDVYDMEGNIVDQFTFS